MDLANEVLDHLFGHVEIGDDAFRHRPDRLDRARGSSKHQLGVLTNRKNLLFAVLHVIRDH